MLLMFFLLLFQSQNSAPFNQDYQFGQDYQNDSSFVQTAAIASVCAVSAVTICYLAQREPNGKIVAHVGNMYASFEKNLDNNGICDLRGLSQHLEIFNNYALEAIFSRECQMIARYGSYVKPWNWSYDMCLAYHKISAIAALKRYISLFGISHNPDAMAICARRAASVFQLYPCEAYLARLYDQVYYISNNCHVLSADKVGRLTLELLSVLREAIVSLQSSKEYFEELNEKRRIALQEEQLQLQRKQVRELEKLNKKIQ